MVKIGVTGLFCSGKDTFANYLLMRGFEHISLSEILRDEARKRSISLTRKNLQKLGNELRKKEGNDILAKKALEKMNDSKDYVISSIRNPLEVKLLASTSQFLLVNIESQIEERFRRLVAREDVRGEDKANLTFDSFVESEKKELSSNDKSAQQIKNCIEMARITIINNQTVENFHSIIQEAMPKIIELAIHVRPTWDEYFTDMSNIVGKRGTCDRGRSGAVLVKDKRVISTGYVGSPPNLAHCDEVGHWFKKTIHDDGNITQHCIRTVHAEANAVAQAAKHGISTEGTTLYCKMEPCLDCTKLLISSGIKRIVCEKMYHGAQESREMFEEAGIKLEVLQKELEHYEGQK